MYTIAHAYRNWLFTLVSLLLSLSTKTPKSKVKATRRYQSCIYPAAADSLFLLLLFCLALHFSVWCLRFFGFDALSPCLYLCKCVHLTDWVRIGDFCSFVTGLMKDIFTFWARCFVCVVALMGNRKAEYGIRLWGLFSRDYLKSNVGKLSFIDA